MKIPSIFRSAYSMADEKVLIDSGATANFLDRRVAKQLGFKPKRLECPVPVKNVDGTPNKDGQLTHCVCYDISLLSLSILIPLIYLHLSATSPSFPFRPSYCHLLMWLSFHLHSYLGLLTHHAYIFISVTLYNIPTRYGMTIPGLFCI